MCRNGLPVQRELECLRSGELDFSGFARATRLEWYRLAAYLMRRWQAPAAVDLDDLVQELLTAAWTFAPKWKANRGIDIQRYVTWNATDKAKKWLHRQREAHKREDKARSRHPLCMSGLVGDDPGRKLEPSVPPEAEVEADKRHVLACALARLDSELDRALLLSLVDARGDVDKAARWLVSSPRCRWLYRIENEATARVAIRRVVRRAAASLTVEELSP